MARQWPATFMLHGVLQAHATEALPEARGTALAGFAMSLLLAKASARRSSGR